MYNNVVAGKGSPRAIPLAIKNPLDYPLTYFSFVVNLIISGVPGGVRISACVSVAGSGVPGY